MSSVWIYVDTNKEIGDKDHLKVFATADAVETWFEENDPEGVAFEYEVLERRRRQLRPQCTTKLVSTETRSAVPRIATAKQMRAAVE